MWGDLTCVTVLVTRAPHQAGPLSEAVPLGRAVAQDLIAQGAQQILMAYAG